MPFLEGVEGEPDVADLGVRVLAGESRAARVEAPRAAAARGLPEGPSYALPERR